MAHFGWFLALEILVLANARPRVSRQAGTPGCPARVVLKSPGTITSPNYPGPYPANSSCTWIITAPKDHTVSLTFGSNFNIMSAPTCGKGKCRCDYVQIRTPTSLQKFCDFVSQPTGPIETSSQRVRVVFKSDATESGSGFSLDFKFVKRESTTVAPFVLRANSPTFPTELPTTTAPEKTSRVPGPETTRKPETLGSTPRITPWDPTSTSDFIANVVAPESTAGKIKAREITEPETETNTPRESTEGYPLVDEDATPWLLYDNGSRVMFQQDVNTGEKQANDEEGVPGTIVLGPAIPIILIFLVVVGSIAWWNFKKDKKERMRYEEITSRAKPYKKKKKKGKESLREIRTKNLYNEMARNWRDQSQYTPSSKQGTFERPQRKRSFAGRLLELAERPVALLTPKSSRPSSMATQEQEVPLVVMREKKLGSRPYSGRASGPFLGPSGSGHRPPSRPASMLLRDALNMIFGATPEQIAEAQKGEPGSASDSKRSSIKRVSFYDRIAEQQEQEREEEEKTALLEPQAQSTVPSILIRQPSYESGDEQHASPPITQRKTPPPVKQKPARHPKPEVLVPVKEPEVMPEEVPIDESEPFDFAVLEKLADEGDREAPHEEETPEGRPSSFERKLVGMLEQLQQEGDELEKEDGAESPREDQPPVPHQTPASPPGTEATSPGGRLSYRDDEMPSTSGT